MLCLVYLICCCSFSSCDIFFMRLSAIEVLLARYTHRAAGAKGCSPSAEKIQADRREVWRFFPPKGKEYPGLPRSTDRASNYFHSWSYRNKQELSIRAGENEWQHIDMPPPWKIWHRNKKDGTAQPRKGESIRAIAKHEPWADCLAPWVAIKRRVAWPSKKSLQCNVARNTGHRRKVLRYGCDREAAHPSTRRWLCPVFRRCP